jgi:hypothetical protein
MNIRNKTWPAKLPLLCGILLFFGCETPMDNTDPPLTAPQSVQLTAGNGQLELNWTKLSAVDGIDAYYKVYYSTSDDVSGELLQGEDVETPSTNLTTTTLTGLVNFQTYYVWVKAIYPGLGESAYSPVTSAFPVPPPNPPTITVVIPGDAMLDVQWQTGDEPGKAATFSYEVYYKAGGFGDIPPTDATPESAFGTSIVLSGLTIGESYRIWIRAVNTAGVSDYVSETGIPAAATEPPTNAPAVITVTPGDGKLILTWDQVVGVPFYWVYYHTGDDSAAAQKWPQSIPTAAPAVRAEITDLTNGTQYYVWVKSANALGESPYSPSANGTPAQKAAIDWTDTAFVLGEVAGEYIFAQDLPASVFWPDGRPNTDRLPRVQETTLGNLFTDAAAWYARNKLGKTFDFVFLNSGYIDNALLKGPVTVGSLSAIVQADARLEDTISLLTLTGAELKEFLEQVAYVNHTGRGGSGTGNFGIVSAEARYTIEYPKPPEGTSPPEGFVAEPYYHGRIKAGTLTINGQPIVDTGNYRILTTNSNATGAYFTSLLNGKETDHTEALLWHGVAEHIYDQGAITPYLDGRIKLEGGVALPAITGWVPGDFEDWEEWWENVPWRQ